VFKLNLNVCASVWHCFCSLCNGHFEGTVMTTERTPSDYTCDVIKHVGVLLTSDEHILCM